MQDASDDTALGPNADTEIEELLKANNCKYLRLLLSRLETFFDSFAYASKIRLALYVLRMKATMKGGLNADTAASSKRTTTMKGGLNADTAASSKRTTKRLDYLSLEKP